MTISDLTGWVIVKDCDDGSLIVEAPHGARVHIWQGGDALLVKRVDELQAQLDEAQNCARHYYEDATSYGPADFDEEWATRCPWLLEEPVRSEVA
jgi:hypothetical protein